ncbi:MAG: imidazoleglycerol-phosphate dehydratase HisB [Methanomicrobiaceae archaeon]|nr:imidazoleglycerol-phosphate dehydratase HisB [Methanomicrobiaceae archaeon]
MRRSEVSRETNETSVRVALELDGTGTTAISTGIAFFDHMLDAFGRHGRLDLAVEAEGDLEVDCHHLVEDTGIVMGMALKDAIGTGKGICRFADAAVPMDESIARVALDCGGRGYLVFRGEFSGYPVGGIPPDLFEHFFYSLCINAGMTANISFGGRNDHHMIEAVFKAFGIALRHAVAQETGSDEIPSTKGVF